MRYSIILLVGATVCALGQGPAAGTIIQGGPGLGGGAITLDFEGFVEGEFIDIQYAAQGVQFFTQDVGGRPQIDNLPQLFGYGPTSGVGVLTGSEKGGDRFPTVAGIIAVFESPVSAAGAWLSDTAPLGDYPITAFDVNGFELESFVLAAEDIPFPGDIFPGSASPDNGIFVGFIFDTPVIGSIQWGRSTAGGDAFAIDDLQLITIQDSDGDGIPDDEDACPDSDLSPTIVIDGCDTEVLNQLFEDGCTMADLIAECAEGAANHGQFVRCVAHLTNEWKRAGLINGREKGRVQSCAARSNIPGDLDGDGAVGVADLVMLLGEWGLCPAQPDACPADLDLDSIVGATDLLMLLGNWG